MRNILLCVLLLATLCSASPIEVVHKSGRFEKASRSVLVKWDIECPVAIDGWSLNDLRRLWMFLDNLAFNDGQGTMNDSDEKDKTSRVSNVNDAFARLAKKLADYDPENGLSGNALEFIATIHIRYANKDWVAIDLTAYDNEGGNGCHSLGTLCVLSRKELMPMPLEWLAKDVLGLQREVIRHLYEDLLKESGQEPFDSLRTIQEATKVKPDFLPTPNGIRFRYKAYEILAGVYGLPEVVVPWTDLEPFCDPERLQTLRELTTMTP